MPDEPTEPLLEGDRRPGQAVPLERAVAPLAGAPRVVDRVIRRGEGQLVDEHAGERLSLHVDPCPEGRYAEQHRVDVLPEDREQPGRRHLSLLEDLILHPERQRPFVRVIHSLPRGEEREGPPPRGADGLHAPLGRDRAEPRILWIGNVRRQDEENLIAPPKRRRRD